MVPPGIGGNYLNGLRWVCLALEFFTGPIKLPCAALLSTVLPRIAVIGYIGVLILAGVLWVVAKIVPTQGTENSDHDAMSK
jgi:hypothetical protein